jgi:acyl-CoA thioester hydrolase
VQRDDYTHWATDTVRFSDQDGVGHINNVAIAAYGESGRVGFGSTLRPSDDGSSFILARLAIDYRVQGHYPGQIEIGSRLVKVGRTSFTMEHGVFKDGECLATAECVLVYVQDGAPAPIEGAFRAQLESRLPA